MTRPVARTYSRKLKLSLLAIAGAVSLLGVASSSALATGGAGWYLTSHIYPTYVTPEGTATIELQVFNVGAADSEGAVTVTYTLPPGIEATETGGAGIGLNFPITQNLWHCTGSSVVTCKNDPSNMPHFAGGAGPVAGEGPNFTPAIAIKIRALPGAPEKGTAVATISGGGAPTSATTSMPVTVSAQQPPFGFTSWDVWASNANGTLDTQAGSHPYAVTFSFDLNTVLGIVNHNYITPEGNVRNLEVQLPPGFVGNPTAVPQCTRQELDETACPSSTMVGFDESFVFGESHNFFRLYNMVPPAGVAAEFAFTLDGVNVFLDSGVRSGSNYAIKTLAPNTPERNIIGNVLTLWGVPADPSHNRWRGNEPHGCSPEEIGSENCPRSVNAQKPLLTLPTACSAALSPFSIAANTWNDELHTARAEAYLNGGGDDQRLTGCEDLTFGPAMSVAPETARADTPAGLTVEVKPPVGGLETPEGLSAADIQNTTVTLPPGLVVNPGQAAGLQACSAAEDGLTTEAERARGEEDDGPAHCPNASKVGTVTIKTPLLEGSGEKQLEGSVYVLQSNPPELELLVAASADGVNVKLVGVVHLNERTGQLTTTFEGTPELPFTDFKLSFSGGAQAALDTPAHCGDYGATADFTPWASPFVSDFLPSAEFALTEGPSGAACPSAPLPFTPSLVAGSTTDQAGGFTSFSLLLQRGDGQQRIDGLQFKAPPGLTGELANVPLCSNEQAETNACPEASKIGHTVVESGPGPYPLVVPEPGQEPAPIYLTGPYNGSGACDVGESGCAPFGLSVVVPLHVGPFVLPTQRVRAKIELNPLTTALTITTNPLPQVVAGVPTDIRMVDAVIDRPDFMINPTNCNASGFTGTAYGTAPPGQNEPSSEAHISSQFQVGACRSLEFTPKIAFSTDGNTSKQDGADLITKITYPSAPQGTYANVGYVKVELPKALPSRLTTLQKACLAKVFEANPAGCPPESKIGYATVHTPLLPVPLTGPAIFVSHGGEAFPSLTMVLQGDGVTIDLVGTTFISKAGITSTTFKTVPDQPFSSFELVLPQGPYSALTANANLCKQMLVIPNEWVGANGALLRQDSALNVTGCAPAITAVSHKVTGRTVTVQVKVPSAGKLVASGRGLFKASKKAKGASTLTVELRLTTSEAAVLSKHKGRKLEAKINLTFTPNKGSKLKTTTSALIG
jgi:hypothetical protein